MKATWAPAFRAKQKSCSRLSGTETGLLMFQIQVEVQLDRLGNTHGWHAHCASGNWESALRGRYHPDMRPPFGDALTSESALVLLNAYGPGISSVHEAEQVIVLSLERGGEAPEESPAHETVDPLLRPPSLETSPPASRRSADTR
jgi:hypothetical protein